MNPVSPLPIFLTFLIAFATCHVLAWRFVPRAHSGRATSIDGLRGYLGLSVFLHHACIWYFFLRTGQWETPPSRAYAHLGQTAVALFFMITGFLFFGKLLGARQRPLDWRRLYLSRLFRLVPMYLFVMGGMLLVVAFLSAWQLQEPAPQLARGIAHWLTHSTGH